MLGMQRLVCITPISFYLSHLDPTFPSKSSGPHMEASHFILLMTLDYLLSRIHQQLSGLRCQKHMVFSFFSFLKRGMFSFAFCLIASCPAAIDAVFSQLMFETKPRFLNPLLTTKHATLLELEPSFVTWLNIFH